MNLKDKIKQDIKSKEGAQLDSEKRKVEWISSVKKLNKQIIEWFFDFKAEGLVEFKTTEKKINEEYLGSYEVDVLHLQFANGLEVIIEPIGTLIIGAWGRLDIYARGYSSAKYYILLNKNEDGSLIWNIVNTENRRVSEPLTKTILEQIFEKWLS